MPFERGKALQRNGVEIPSDMKLDGDIRNCRQEDELNSEKCSTADTLGRLAIAATTFLVEYSKKDLEHRLKEVVAVAMMLKNPMMQKLVQVIL